MIEKIKSVYSQDSKMFNNILGTTLIKGLSLILSIYSITAYLHFFNGDKIVYGVWLTIISVLNWVVMFDLGIGNGLRNKLAEAFATSDQQKGKTLISSAYLLIAAVSVAVFICFSVASVFINWNVVFNIDSEIISREVLNKAVLIAFVGLIVHFVLKLVISVLYALKETAFGSVVPFLINLLILLYSFMFQEEDPSTAIIKIAIAYAVTLVIPLVAVTIFVFRVKLKGYEPSLKYYNNKIAIGILSLGGQFFIVQLLLLVINSTNEMLITQLDQPESVVVYNIYFRLFSAVIALFSVITNPVWSSVVECYANSDLKGVLWRKKVLSRIALLFGVGNFILAFTLQYFVDFFYKASNVDIDIKSAIAFAVFSTILICINSTSCIENGINDLKPQIIGNGMAAIIKIPLSIIIYRITNTWMAVVYANIIIMAISYIIQRIGLSRSLKNIESKIDLQNINIDSNN